MAFLLAVLLSSAAGPSRAGERGEAAEPALQAALPSLQAAIVRKRAEEEALFGRMAALRTSCAASIHEHESLRLEMEDRFRELEDLCKEYNARSDMLATSQVIASMRDKDASTASRGMAEHLARNAFTAEMKEYRRASRGRFDAELFSFQVCLSAHEKRRFRTRALYGLAVAVVLALLVALWHGLRGRRLGPAPAEGSVVKGGYRILREASRRDWGVVFEAEDSALKRKCLLLMVSETLADDRRAVARFLEAARLAADIKHDNLLQTYAMFEEGGRLFLACEHSDGRPLDELLSGGRRIGLAPAMPLLRQIAAALGCVHGRNLLYGFLNPALVLVSREGSVKLMGLAVAHGMLLAGKGRGGLSSYGAPELARGEAYVESDVYSLAAIAHALLGGRPPGPAQEAAAGGPYAVLRKGLHADPRQRYRSAAELLAAFEGLR